MNLTNGSRRCGFRDDILDDVRTSLRDAQSDLGQRDVPVTTLSYAQSIDGSIALSEGRTLHLSNRESQTLTHRIRSLHDAILVGINTVLADDPQLTVRLAPGKNPQPVIVDSALRFPLSARLLRDPCVRPIIATGIHACPRQEAELTAAGARVLQVPVTHEGRVDLTRLFMQLKERGFHSVMVEGGAGIITSMLASRLVDQLIVTISPRLVGGLPAIKSLSDSARAAMPQLTNLHYASLAGDLIIRGDLAPEVH